MKVPGSVNAYRRKIMHFITKNVGSSQSEPEFNANTSVEIKNILIISS